MKRIRRGRKGVDDDFCNLPEGREERVIDGLG